MCKGPCRSQSEDNYSIAKQTICNEKASVCKRKIDTIVADDTGTIKLILWEQLIASVHSGLSYHFNNLTICIFDDEKFVNSNGLTAVEPIDNIAIHIESPEKKTSY